MNNKPPSPNLATTAGGSESDASIEFLKALEAIQYDRPEYLRGMLGRFKNPNDINALTILGTSLLHEAIRQSNPEMVKILLEHGANPNIRNKNGQTPLHMSIMGCPATLSLVIAAGGEVNVKDANDMTPLHGASLADSAETYILLLEAGADPATVNSDGKTPMECWPLHSAQKALVLAYQERQRLITCPQEAWSAESEETVGLIL